MELSYAQYISNSFLKEANTFPRRKKSSTLTFDSNLEAAVQHLQPDLEKPPSSLDCPDSQVTRCHYYFNSSNCSPYPYPSAALDRYLPATEERVLLSDGISLLNLFLSHHTSTSEESRFSA